VQFVPAKNKLEAVARISFLTNSGPEELGPGSKERKSVFINLARGLKINFSESDTKQEIAKKVVVTFGGVWDASCESVGQTVTLIGLNRILKLAEQKLESANQNFAHDIENIPFDEEVKRISSIAVDATPLDMNGKNCVTEMRDVEYKEGWRQTEWQGWYFQMKMQEALTTQIGGGRKKIFNTEFDYVYRNIWDLKAHSIFNAKGKSQKEAQLNDSEAMDAAISNGGLGLIVLNGVPTYDMEFTRWHKAFRGNNTGEPRKTLKSHFVANSLEIFFIPSTDRLQEAIAKKELKSKPQGKNSNGKPRKDKYWLDLEKSQNSDLIVFNHNFI
jgi:hypothetical protein